MDLTDAQKKDMMSFVHDDGKGFVGIHAVLGWWDGLTLKPTPP